MKCLKKCFKSIAVCLVFALILASAFPMISNAEDTAENSSVVGDVNADGNINLLDLISLRKHLAKWSVDIGETAADCNADGEVNLLDLILMRKYLVGIIKAFPADNAADEIIAYSINRTAFDDFINNPEQSFFDNANSGVAATVISEVDGKIVLNGQEYQNGIARLNGDLPVYDELIDFVGNTEKIKVFLNQNNVEAGDVTNVKIICSNVIPVVIWVEAGETDSFITVCEKQGDFAFDSPHYVYRAYAKEDFYDRFSGKSGAIIVNGKVIETEYSPVMYHDCAVLPFFEIIKALGAEISWSEYDSAQIVYDGKNYEYLSCDEYDMISLKQENDTRNYFLPAPGDELSYTIVDNEIMIMNYSADAVFELFGVQCEMDYDSLTVDIS